MVDAEVTTIDRFPYLAYLEPKKSYHCGSAIISPYHILTAAHCVMYDDPKNVKMRVGSTIRTWGGNVHWVRNFTTHPKFHLDNRGNSENDVAVLLLDKPIVFNNETVAPIAMFDYGEKIRLGSAAKIAGWGRTHPEGFLSSYVRSIKMEVVDKKNCTEIYKDIEGIQAGEICAVAAEKETQSPCMGDSGGPLVIKGRLAGFFTHTENCSTIMYPTVFTEVSHFRDWIDQAIKELDDAKKESDSKGNQTHFTENEVHDNKENKVRFVLKDDNKSNGNRIRFPENPANEGTENLQRFAYTVEVDKNNSTGGRIHFAEDRAVQGEENLKRFVYTVGEEKNNSNEGQIRFPETENEDTKRKRIRIRFPVDKK